MHGFQLWANLPVVAEDDRAALSGRRRARHSRSGRRRRDARAGDVRRVLGQEGTGRRRRRRSALSRRLGAAGQPQAAAGRNDAPRVRVRLRGLRHVPRRVGAAGVSDRAGRRQRDGAERDDAGNRSLVLFDRGDEVVVQAGDEGIRFLLVSGKPIEEPVAWYGPIVMNTEEELRQALSDCATARSFHAEHSGGYARASASQRGLEGVEQRVDASCSSVAGLRDCCFDVDGGCRPGICARSAHARRDRMSLKESFVSV